MRAERIVRPHHPTRRQALSGSDRSGGFDGVATCEDALGYFQFEKLWRKIVTILFSTSRRHRPAICLALRQASLTTQRVFI